MHSLSGGKLPWVTKLSSAGLVYFHFGQRIVAAIAGMTLYPLLVDYLYIFFLISIPSPPVITQPFSFDLPALYQGAPVDSDVTNTLYTKVYENFIEEVDAIDNGIATSDGPMR